LHSELQIAKYFGWTLDQVRLLSQGEYEACLAMMFRHPIDSTLHLELVKSQCIQLGTAGVKDTKTAYSMFESHYNLPSWLREESRFVQSDDEINAEIERMKRLMANETVDD